MNSARVSSLLLSDYHAGQKQTRRARKLLAVDAIMARARQPHIREILLAGDIADERPDREAVQEECAVLRNAIGDLSSIYLRGNHDGSAFFDESEIAELLNSAMCERPWHVAASGIVVTHGHHFHARPMKKALRNNAHSDDLESLCCEDHLAKSIRRMTFGFTLAGKCSTSLEHRGIPAYEIWEQSKQLSLRARSKLAKLIRRKRPEVQKRDFRTAIANAIDLRSIRRAALLAQATGSWGAAMGHTHVPGLYKQFLKDEETGVQIPFLIGNSGSFVSRYSPTCLEVQYPRMILWQYDEKTHTLKQRDVIELTAEEQEVQQAYLQRRLKRVA